MCACAEPKKSFNFYRNENQFFFACYTLISHEWESCSNRPEMINVIPLNSKILGGQLLRFLFLFSIYSNALHVYNESISMKFDTHNH